jgi:tripartite ATP-independent transporter DctP family solute receptor
MKASGKIRMAVLALFASATMADAQQVSLRLASFANDGDTFGQAQARFGEELARLSDGRIGLEIFNNNTLGSNREALEIAMTGGIDFVVTGLAHATRYAPELNAVLLPYLWTDRAAMFGALDGEIGGRLSATLGPQGLSIAAWWDNGFRHVSNNRGPIMQPEDIAGLRLRTLPSAVHVAFFRELGAIPTPMDFSELMPALRQGVIDGQENPPQVVYPYQIYEAQRFYSLTGHVNEPMVLVMSTATSDRLSEADRAIVAEAAAAATGFQREINDARTAELLESLRAHMEINEVPEATLARFREVALSIYDAALADMGDEGRAIVEAIIASSR